VTEVDHEQLRQIIVWATVPLISEYETLTTARIAEAGGVDEADLLAVFADKEAIMQACTATLTAAVAAALDPEEAVRKLGAIRKDQPLTSRLVQVINIVDAYFRRTRITLDALRLASVQAANDADASDVPLLVPNDEIRSIGIRSFARPAVANLLEPDEQHLLLPPRVLADAFVGMIFGIWPVGPDQVPPPAEQVVNLFLHGAVINDG
jgi:AcrR family transcriptional regulator